MNFTSKILSYIQTHQLCPPDAKLIVGVSGGADSVALLHCLHNNGFQCLVAHCNFHLRGAESDADAVFVQTLAQKWELPFFHIDFDTKQVASENGISIEMAARNLRYEWFLKLMATESAHSIAVAHHSDDAIETFFINLCRGTGLRGLLGIQPRQGAVIRPFLAVSRQDINHYIKDQALTFRTDQSNFDQTIVRNKIRHTVIPALEAINPSFGNTMNGNFERLYEIFNITTQYIDDLKRRSISDHGSYISISIEELKKQDNLSFSLFELLYPYQFNATTVQDILRAINGESGSLFYSKTHRLVKDRNTLLIEPLSEKETTSYYINNEDKHISVPLCLHLSEPMDANSTAITRDKNKAYFDFNKLKFPLEIRHPQTGDYFYPFGNAGRKKLSDFFIDEKWSRIEKENCWLLLSDNQIAWIIGHRTDNRFRIDEKSQKTLIIDFSPEVV